MVYARYIKRGGKALGPYYYESVKGEDGKIKSIYLGRKPPVAKQGIVCEGSSSVKSFSEEEPKTSPVICGTISQLKKNIQICEVRKKQIRAKLGELAEKQEKGIISYVKHELLLNSYLNGETVEYWDRYYDELKLRLAAQVKKYESFPREQVPGHKLVVEEVKTDLYSKVDALSDKVEKLESLLAKEPAKPRRQSFFDLYEITPAGKLVVFMLIILLITAPGLFLLKGYSSGIQSGIIEEDKTSLVKEGKIIEGYKMMLNKFGISAQQQKPEEFYEKEVVKKKPVGEEQEQEPGMVSKIIGSVSQFFGTASPTGFAITEEGATLPEENVTLPEENVTIPEENITLPEGVTIPEENITVPEENVTMPEESVTLPEENVTIPEEPLLENLTETLTGFEDKLKAKPYKPNVRLKNLIKEENKFVLEAESEDKKGKIVIRGLYNVSDIEDLQVTTLSGKKVSKGLITTPVVLANVLALENATITLPKEGNVNAIIKCENWDFLTSTCEAWIQTNIPFADDGENITFTVTEFSGYAGAEITIINVQSYPSVGGNWTVEFTTIGTANLTIKAVDGTTWNNANEIEDLRFLEIKCGDQVLNYEWVDNAVFIQDYECNETGYETSKVITGGEHTLMFQFGEDVDYAKNRAMIDTDGGILAYIEGTVREPRYVLYNMSTQLFDATEYNATEIGANIEHIWVKCSPVRDECALLTADANDDIKIQFYSWINTGSWTKCWHDGSTCNKTMTLEVQGQTNDGDKAAMMYENESGNLVLVWASMSANTLVTSINYTIWNGSDLVQNGSLDNYNLRTNGTAEWIRLAPQLGTNNVSMAYSTSTDWMGIITWGGQGNGSGSWGCEAEPEQNLTHNNAPKVDITHADPSGNLFAVGGSNISTTSPAFVYLTRPWDSCTYTKGYANNLSAFTESADQITVAPYWGSDNITVAWEEWSGDDTQWAQWVNGSFALNKPTDNTSLAEGAGNRYMAPACARGLLDGCIVAYSDGATSIGIDWNSYSPSSDRWTTRTDVTGRGMNDDEENTECYPYPGGPFYNESILCIFEDEAADLWAKVYNNRTDNWTHVEGAPAGDAIENNTGGVAEFRSFNFDFMYKGEYEEAGPNTAPNDPTVILNFTYADTNYTNESMWCQVYVDDPNTETDMSVDISIINSTSEFGDYVEQYSLSNAFTSITEPRYVQFMINETNFTKGDFLICQARVNDQEATSNWVNSSNLSVQNYPVQISDPLGNWSINEDFVQFMLNWTANYTDVDDVEGKEAFINWTYEMNDTNVLTISMDNDTNVVTITPIADAFGSVEINWTVLDDDNAQYNETVVWTVNSVNDAPVIENITYQSGLGANGVLSEGVPTPIIISFLAMDMDGCNNFDNTSAFMNVTLDGTDTRKNDTIGNPVTCYPETIGSNATAQNYTCTIDMQYWDLNGGWNCTAQVSDSSTNTSLAVDNCFTVGTTTAINISAATLSWPQLGIGAVDKLMSTAEINITNIGNQNLTNVTLQAINLVGEITSTVWIPTANFTAPWGERSCNTGAWLINDTDIQILGNGVPSGAGALDYGPGSLATTNNATHICLEEVGQDITYQSYSTAGDVEDWLITGGTGPVT